MIMIQEGFLGIDTSCYTTSVAVIARDGSLIAEARKILDVKEGRCGLQQSEMVFQHTRNLPALMEQVFCDRKVRLLGVAVSGFPRPLPDSYMPAFLAGVSVAKAVALVNDLPLHIISHQENHMEAGMWSAHGPASDRFLMLHASGGTTDLLLCVKNDRERYDITQIGGSIDLHAGQFIDRIGVALGMQFPAGKALEKLAETAKIMEEVPVSVRGTNISLSGPATSALRTLQSCENKAGMALGVEYALAESFVRMIRNGAAEHDLKDVLLVGGVASNKFIREHVIAKLKKRNISVWIPEADFSCDNASGCAAFARRMGDIDE